MELAVGPAALALALALLLLRVLYGRCGSFRFFCKMGFYNGWILLLALVAVPLCALRGRHVHNMRIIRGLLQHVKHLYGIQMSVRGAQNFPPRQPYVVVSNHQSSLDLMGMMEVLPDRCVPIAKRELLYMGAVGLVCWLGGIIFIDRKRTSDAISVMAEGRARRAHPGRACLGVPRGDAQPQRLHAALQARGPSTWRCRRRSPSSPSSSPRTDISTARASAGSTPGAV
ncbi:hypothetical protein Q9966_016530 [Columba livia]|nr:hypothetical protein Q9966_016530 [Columba livia]